MISLPQNVKIKWTNANRKHLESKGYIYTKNGEEIEINVEHLSEGSKKKYG